MATRKSWRRAVAPHSPHQRNQSHLNRRTSTNSNTSAASNAAPGPFAGITDDALATILAVLLGKPVTLTAIDGSVYDGHFSATERVSPKHPLNIVLRYASVVTPSPKSAAPLATIVDLRGSIANRILVPVTSVSILCAAPPDFNSTRNHSRNTESTSNRKLSAFATDAEISRATPGVGRPLQRFEHFSEAQPVSRSSSANNPSSLDEQTFGEIAHSQPSLQKWDQFQVNEDKFGVTTTFDENEYTTEIDRKGPDYEQRERQAARIASEIEASSSDNIHIREERNQAIAEDYDEEDRYSGVPRNTQHKQSDTTRITADPRPTRPLSYAAAAAAANSRAPALVVKSANQNRQQPQKPQSQSYANKPQSNKSNIPLRSSNHQPKPSHSPAQPTQANLATPSRTNSNTPQPKPVQPPSKTHIADKPVASEKLSQPAKAQANGKSTQSSKDKRSDKTPSSTSHNSLSPPSGSTDVASLASPLPSKDSDAPKENNVSQEGVPLKVDASLADESIDSKDDAPQAKFKNGKSTLQKDSSSQGSFTAPVVKPRSSITGILSPAQSRNSPGSAGTSTIGVLNLDAHPPNLPEKIQQFNRYRIERASQVIKENRAQISHGFKEFSSKLDSKSGPSRRGFRSGGAVSSGNLDSPGVSSSSMSSNAQERKSKSEGTEDGNTNLNNVDKDTEAKATAVKDESVVVDKPEVSDKSLPSSEEPKVADQETGEVKPKPKMKSKLNPKAAEFRPTSIRNPTPPVTPMQPAHLIQYGPGVEFSRAMQGIPPGYAMPVQPMPQFPYGQAYTMMMPAPMPNAIPGAGGFQYVPSPGIPMGQVPGRFQQNVATPVSYGYGPPGPMVLAEPSQRIPSGAPYPQFYNGPPFSGPQGGGSPLSPSMQPGMFVKVSSAQHGGGQYGQHGQHGQHAGPHGGMHSGGMHMHGGGMGMNNRGNGHGGTNGRRGGLGRSRGRQHGHHHVQHSGHQNGHVNASHVASNPNSDKIANSDRTGGGGVGTGSVGVDGGTGLQGTPGAVTGGGIGATSNHANGMIG